VGENDEEFNLFLYSFFALMMSLGLGVFFFNQGWIEFLSVSVFSLVGGIILGFLVREKLEDIEVIGL